MIHEMFLAGTAGLDANTQEMFTQGDSASSYAIPTPLPLPLPLPLPPLPPYRAAAEAEEEEEEEESRWKRERVKASLGQSTWGPYKYSTDGEKDGGEEERKEENVCACV